MNYDQGIQYMLNLASQSGSFQPYHGITINYPGYKRRGDYKLTVNGGRAPRHQDICLDLYNLINQGNYNFQTLQDFLSDVYLNGTNTNYNDPYLKQLQHLIYWITLQEEINYPRSKGFAGINLAFCRFYEAIYATHNTNTITLQNVQNRCNNHRGNKPQLYTIHNAPSFYHY